MGLIIWILVWMIIALLLIAGGNLLNLVNKITEDKMSNYDSVGFVHRHFGLPYVNNESIPHLIDDTTANFRLRFLHEELVELQKAYGDNDLTEIADALIDLVIVAMGTAQMHGLPWEELFEMVTVANLAKVRATSPEQSKRGTSLDLIKPEGWKKPDLLKILRDHGWHGVR